ncbi:MAG: hypothetical protein QF578_13310 [Alphaproteobacteria bacterium]|jgi:hypothetical protein|nr:hypothetical protein [Alphaproteobacteria bacterium]MDP6814521.1 hypothetical protein [Alphaproteobacteria bacterium]
MNLPGMPRISAASMAATMILGVALPGAPHDAQAAGTPVAVVEDADPGRQDLGLFEMLEAGRRIALKDGEVLVLGYLQSCNRETITGGQVVVGARQSAVEGGQVEREIVNCAGGQVALSKDSKGKAGVVVFRKGPKKKKRGAMGKPVTIHVVSPVLRLTQGATVITLRRTDRPEATWDLNVTSNMIDFLAAGVRLSPGGRYDIAAGRRRLTLRVAADAGNGANLFERLVVF